jgi:hypothetical protein
MARLYRHCSSADSASSARRQRWFVIVAVVAARPDPGSIPMARPDGEETKRHRTVRAGMLPMASLPTPRTPRGVRHPLYGLLDKKQRTNPISGRGEPPGNIRRFPSPTRYIPIRRLGDQCPPPPDSTLPADETATSRSRIAFDSLSENHNPPLWIFSSCSRLQLAFMIPSHVCAFGPNSRWPIS